MRISSKNEPVIQIRITVQLVFATEGQVIFDELNALSDGGRISAQTSHKSGTSKVGRHICDIGFGFSGTFGLKRRVIAQMGDVAGSMPDQHIHCQKIQNQNWGFVFVARRKDRIPCAQYTA